MRIGRSGASWNKKLEQEGFRLEQEGLLLAWSHAEGWEQLAQHKEQLAQLTSKLKEVQDARSAYVPKRCQKGFPEKNRVSKRTVFRLPQYFPQANFCETLGSLQTVPREQFYKLTFVFSPLLCLLYQHSSNTALTLFQQCTDI